MKESSPIYETPLKLNTTSILPRPPTASRPSVEMHEPTAPLPLVNTFPKDLQGPYVITANGKNNNITGRGIIHIGNSLRKLNVKPKDLRVIGKNTIRLEFPDIHTANSFLKTALYWNF